MPSKKSSKTTTRWSRKHDRCVECGTTEVPHRSFGKCESCGYKQYRIEHAEEIKARYKKWWKKNSHKYYEKWRKQRLEERKKREKREPPLKNTPFRTRGRRKRTDRISDIINDAERNQ